MNIYLYAGHGIMSNTHTLTQLLIFDMSTYPYLYVFLCNMLCINFAIVFVWILSSSASPRGQIKGSHKSVV